MGGKVLLIGNALAGFRPYTVASTSQAAYDALLLAGLVSGKITHGGYVKRNDAIRKINSGPGCEDGDSEPIWKGCTVGDIYCR